MNRLRFSNILTAAPNDYLYGLEKLRGWLRGAGSGVAFGDAPIKQLRQAVKEFEAEIEYASRKDMNEPEEVAYLSTRIMYALDQLESYINKRESDINSDQAAEVFVDFLNAKFYSLLHIAYGLDIQHESQ